MIVSINFVLCLVICWFAVNVEGYRIGSVGNSRSSVPPPSSTLNILPSDSSCRLDQRVRSLSMLSTPSAASNLNSLISSNYRSKRLYNRASRAAQHHTHILAASSCDCSNLKSANTPSSKPMRLIIAGAPAAGKGTQCEVIKAKYNVVHLSTGDILRAAVKAGTELGLKAKAFMDAGQLVPDELIIGVVKDRLQEDDCRTRGWLLDGFPRTKSQADALMAAGLIPDSFILLDVPEAVLVERVTGRRTDPVTGKIYHLKFNPPENAEIAARLVQRSDDTEEKIKVRYREFQSHIQAIRSSYEDRLIAVDGSLHASKVSELLTKSLDKVHS